MYVGPVNIFPNFWHCVIHILTWIWTLHTLTICYICVTKRFIFSFQLWYTMYRRQGTSQNQDVNNDYQQQSSSAVKRVERVSWVWSVGGGAIPPLWWNAYSDVTTSILAYQISGWTLLFRLTSKKTSKPSSLAFCEGNPPVTGGFPSQRICIMETISIWLRHRDDENMK